MVHGRRAPPANRDEGVVGEVVVDVEEDDQRQDGEDEGEDGGVRMGGLMEAEELGTR